MANRKALWEKCKQLYRYFSRRQITTYAASAGFFLVLAFFPMLVLLMGLNLIGGRCIDMTKSKIVTVNEKIAEAVVSGYKKTESAVVDGYKKVESAVVGGYTKIEDKFVNKHLTRDGETVEEATQRLKEQK